MRIALVAPPFIPVPPIRYGGTELFVADLAEGLCEQKHHPVVYANGESRVGCEIRWLYPASDWPPVDPGASHLRNADHTAWAIAEAARRADVLHVNDAIALPFTRFVDLPVIMTLHHPHEPALAQLYARYPDVQYVCISHAQAARETMSSLSVIHHGVSMDRYTCRDERDDYLVFLGRMAPCKGAHVAVDVARRAGLRLKLAGEIQPLYDSYWREQVLPHIDGDRIQYVGEATHDLKNDLLSRARGLLFPIEWEEPFGLVMIEAMACGTPVLAFARGSVSEIVADGTSGWICRDVDDMAARAATPCIAAESCRSWAAGRFARERMVEQYVEVYERSQSDGRRAIGLETVA
jgi:glycosyltransferase involved in cell wall biosynthesis